MVEQLCIGPGESVRAAALTLNQTVRGIVLVVGSARELLGTITDGDVRRAMLANLSLETPVADILKRKAGLYAQPITAPLGTDPETLLTMMRKHSVHQIPLLDLAGAVVDLATMDDLLPDQDIGLQAVIMAGGFGQRLRPLTEETPKPMLHIGDRPLLERTIEQLRSAGIRRVNVTTHYLPDKITSHFGNGADFGVDLNYVNEDTPLGTAGALGLMDTPRETVLVMNGDILTRVNYRSMLSYHREHRADLTIAVRQFGLQVPYGVVECDGANVVSVQEKPTVNYLVNAGIYLLEPSVYSFIEIGQHCDMPELIHRLLAAGRTVCSFLIHEYWLDIGKYADYIRAQEDVQGEAFT